MKVEFGTLKRAVSTLVVLCVLFLGMGLDASAHQRERRDWGRSHNRGRHLGWTRGRRVGQHRRDDDRRDWRRRARRERRSERRYDRRHRRSDWENNRNREGSRYRQSGSRRSRY